jgi:hypothetical protein
VAGGPGGVVGAPGGGPGGPGGVVGAPGGGPGGPGGNLGTAAIDYLVANRGSASWIVAVGSANEAAPIEIATGLPVMAMGGFSGGDPALSVATLQSLVTSGRLRFIVAGGLGIGGFRAPGFFGGRGTAEVAAWVNARCTALRSVAAGLYDCSPATGS